MVITIVFITAGVIAQIIQAAASHTKYYDIMQWVT
jgi:hypothetical protein